jgi:hypothetical protein
LLVIFLQAVGGLVVAVVVKYADNILKGFAAAFSIITACIICYFFLDFKPTILFAFGAVLVNLSIYIYDRGLPPLLLHLLRPATQEKKTKGGAGHDADDRPAPPNSLANTLKAAMALPMLNKDPAEKV